MPALAYLLPPLSGLIAYFKAATPRARFHGLQASLFGFLWPLLIYAASSFTPGATQGTFFVGAALWILLLVVTALGRDPCIPGTGEWLRRWSAAPPF